MSVENKYCILFDDPDKPDEPTSFMILADTWLKMAMSGGLPPISVFLKLNDDERKAIDEGWHKQFKHDPETHQAQWTAPRIGPLTEEEAVQYVAMKSLPRKCWTKAHNRPMFKIVLRKDMPKDRTFRDAWEMAT